MQPVVPGLLPAPANLEAEAISSTEIRLAWDAVDRADYYHVKWVEGAGPAGPAWYSLNYGPGSGLSPYYLTGSGLPDATEVTVAGLAAGSRYGFVVSAGTFSDYGAESKPSLLAGATMPAAPPSLPPTAPSHLNIRQRLAQVTISPFFIACFRIRRGRLILR